jgi:GDPmannose 4,6-dehydratase
MMMQHDNPDDWVLATGETYTVKDFLDITFKKLNLNWEEYVETSEKYLRPNEVDYLLGDASKANKKLGWKPKTSFSNLVDLMIESDLNLAKREEVLLNEGLIQATWESSQK